MSFHQSEDFLEPHIGIFTTLTQPNWGIVGFPIIQHLLNGFFGIVVPIFMKTDDRVIIPKWKNAIVIVSPTIALNNDDVLLVHFSNGVRNIHHQFAQGNIVHFITTIRIFAFKVPVRFIDDVICTYPRAIFIAFGHLFP